MVATPVAEALVGPVREALDRIQSMLSSRRGFDPAVDERTFTVTASDYAAMAVLHPLLAYLTTKALDIALRIHPVGAHCVEQLIRSQTDLLIIPRAVCPGGDGFCLEPLYTDRYMLAVDAANLEVGDTITIEQFSTLPYLATHLDLHPTLPDQQLDLLGIPRHVEATTGIAVAPFLLRGTRLVTFVPEIWARRIVPCAGLRLLEPPMPLQPLTETMVWTRRFDDDPAHIWLRRQLQCLADELTGNTEAQSSIKRVRPAGDASVTTAGADTGRPASASSAREGQASADAAHRAPR